MTYSGISVHSSLLRRSNPEEWSFLHLGPLLLPRVRGISWPDGRFSGSGLHLHKLQDAVYHSSDHQSPVLPLSIAHALLHFSSFPPSASHIVLCSGVWPASLGSSRAGAVFVWLLSVMYHKVWSLNVSNIGPYFTWLHCLSGVFYGLHMNFKVVFFKPL